MLHGNVTLDELMSRLLAAHEQYTAQLAVEVREEEERAARDAVKREQDLAFEMSLMVLTFFFIKKLVKSKQYIFSVTLLEEKLNVQKISLVLPKHFERF